MNQDFIVSGIVCKVCKYELPQMLMSEHLDKKNPKNKCLCKDDKCNNFCCRCENFVKEKLDAGYCKKCSIAVWKELEEEISYCDCGRKEEKDSVGCRLWPSCCDEN
jgi:hypothetical protein